jgi:hypothetical protein
MKEGAAFAEEGEGVGDPCRESDTRGDGGDDLRDDIQRRRRGETTRDDFGASRITPAQAGIQTTELGSIQPQ